MVKYYTVFKLEIVWTAPLNPKLLQKVKENVPKTQPGYWWEMQRDNTHNDRKLKLLQMNRKRKVYRALFSPAGVFLKMLGISFYTSE